MDPSRSPLIERAERYVDRRRLVIGLCAAVVVALVAAIPGILTSADSGRNVRTAEFAQVTPTTAALPSAGVVSPLDTPQATGPAPAPPTTTQPALVLGTNFSRPTPTTAPKAAAKPAPKPSSPASPAPGGGATLAPTCHNSYDASCGPFRWDRDPGQNQPMTGQVTSDPPAPKAGDTVSFHLTASDPDAAPAVVCVADFGKGEQGFVCDPRPKMDPNYCKPQYGPWTPPATQRGDLDTVEQHQYANPGKYDVSFTINSAQEECNNPYASTVTVTTTVFVG